MCCMFFFFGSGFIRSLQPFSCLCSYISCVFVHSAVHYLVAICFVFVKLVHCVIQILLKDMRFMISSVPYLMGFLHVFVSDIVFHRCNLTTHAFVSIV